MPPDTSDHLQTSPDISRQVQTVQTTRPSPADISEKAGGAADVVRDISDCQTVSFHRLQSVSLNWKVGL